MPKQIPTIGDPNWGTPLNAHLAQLQNPTTGGINTFEQFSGRPTNLTTDDAGKTYLYSQTGNLHQWTGTTWKVLNESVNESPRSKLRGINSAPSLQINR